MSDFGDFSDFTAGDISGATPQGNGGSTVAPDLESAMPVAEDFIDAVLWGDHTKVWELIGSSGRTEVLDVATKRGMDEGMAACLAADDGSPSETREFLADLLNGLRAELAGNDLDNITFEIDLGESQPGRAAVKMFVPLHKLLGGTLPIGTLFLVPEHDTWRVERLIPLTSK